MDRNIQGFTRITTTPGKLAGKPCIRGLRISVTDVMRAMAAYDTRESLLADYPDLEPEDLVEAVEFAVAMMDWERLPGDETHAA